MLSAQLQQSASLNASFLKTHKNVESYLFTPQQARQHDLDTIFQLAQNGLQLLSTSSKQIKSLNSPLFSSSSKFTDRTKLSTEENNTLNVAIEKLLFALAPFLMEQAASKVIEWLVRRYRANEFNVDILLTVFLPYHATPHFIKLVSILHIPQNSAWSFLIMHKKATTVLHRETLLKEMLSNPLFAKSVLNTLQKHVTARAEHHAVIGFSLAVTLQYITRAELDSVELAFLLPAIMAPLTESRSTDVASASLVLLAHLSQNVTFTLDALPVILSGLASTTTHVEPTSILSALSLILQHQSPLTSLSNHLITSLLSIPDLPEALSSCQKWLIAPKVLSPLAAGFSTRASETPEDAMEDVQSGDKNPAFAALEALFSFQTLSSEAARALCMGVLRHWPRGQESETERYLALLRRMYQLFPEALRFNSEDPEPNEDDIQKIIESVIMFPGERINSDKVADAVVLASSADVVVRARAVKALLANDGSPETGALLLSTMEDARLEVIQTLYSEPEIFVNIVGVDAIVKQMEHLMQPPINQNISTEMLCAHVEFLAKVSKQAQSSDWDIGAVLFGYLIVTKAGFKRSTAVWNILVQHGLAIDHSELLKGATFLSGIDWKEMKGDQAAMAAFNDHLVQLIAGNIVTSPRYEASVEFLLAQARMHTASTHALLGLLTSYALLNTINGARKLDLGIRLIELITFSGLNPLQTVEAKSIDEGDIKVIDYSRVVSKPEHQSTHGRLYAAILLLLPMLPRSSSRMDWFSRSNTPKGCSATFSRDLYVLLNRSSVAPNLCTLALRGLFLSLQDKTLLLLTSIWSDFSVIPGVRTAALKHAQAFIRALLDPHAGTISKDLQVIFPFLVAAVYDSHQGVRDAAVVCIQLLAGVKREKGSKAPDVYGFNSLPEEVSATIKFLEWQDFLRYAKALAEWAEVLQVDATTLISLHEDILHVTSEDPGKDSRYRKRILSYILSHATAWPSPSLQLALLACTSSVQDVNKLPLVAPLIEKLSMGDAEVLLTGLDQDQRQIYINSLLSTLDCIDSSNSGLVFPALLELVRKGLSNPEKESALRGAPIAMKAVTLVLQTSQKLELCHLLLSLTENFDQTKVLELLAHTLDDEETLVALLRQLRPISADEQPAKRPRREKSATEPLEKLGKACQALSLSSHERSISALSTLLDSLGATLDARSMEHAELPHIQQVIMTALSHASQYVIVQAGTASQLRIDVLVKLVKDSANPQIVHQALLVIAALAQWSSDSLLHHIMPILLSAGNYISPREDVYSARVAEKTIDSVIPVLISHLRSKHGKKGSLQIAAKPYLDIFVDAATAIPLHRRISFFMHLISILGPVDFLNPICILLLEPCTSSDGSKKRLVDRTSLTASIIQSRSLDARLVALAELVEDVVTEVSLPRSEDTTFLSSLRSTPDKDLDRITVIMDIVDQTLQRSRGVAKLGGAESPQRILAALVRLLAHENNQNPSEEVERLRQHLNSAVAHALRLVSASTMLFTCLQLLRSNDLGLQIELYTLLARALSDVSGDARAKMSSDVILMVKIIKDNLNTSQSPELSIAAMKALQSIAKTSLPMELSALAETVPIIIHSHQISQLAECGMQTLNMICGTLGPRIIPQLASVIGICCLLLRGETSSEKAFSTATTLIRHLLDTASSFWTTNSTETVLYVYTLRSTTGKERDKAAMNALGKHMTRKLPTQVLIAALIKIWKNINAERNTHSQAEKTAIFVIMRQGIKTADRSSITTEARSLLSVIMEAWDDPTHMEDNAPSIKAFIELVIKLNETSFKPLYRILFDWAWTPDHESTVFSREHRAIAYCQAMGAMQDVLKGLVTPYMAPFIGRAAEALDLWSQAPTAFTLFELWRKIIGLIKQSADVDDGAFWRDEYVRIISPSLVRQIHVASNQQHTWMAPLLADALSALGRVAVDDAFLKMLNVDLLMITREESPKIRLCALRCVGRLWLENGRRLAGWKHDTVPFLHECAEDENEDVVAEARSLKVILDQF